MGFTAAHIVPDSGVFQGQTAFVQLDNEGTVIKQSVALDINYEVDDENNIVSIVQIQYVLYDTFLLRQI